MDHWGSLGSKHGDRVVSTDDYCGIMPEKDKEGAGLGRESLSLQCRSDRVSANPVGSWEQGLLVSPLHWAEMARF